ncbi:MAG: extracellular solute-binding protein [Lachnospiraceae bacterium]|nr:extracellular solute-binding protein [Lachnospiraceae bacterium]
MKKRLVWMLMLLSILSGCGSQQSEETMSGENTEMQEEMSEETLAAWKEAAETPYGKYPELVTYTLGKLDGANNSNMPAGDTYENNVYTRALRATLNIQNEDVFEENGEQYVTSVEMAIASEELPDIMIVEDKETLIRLTEKGLIADLTECYETCASDGIKAMYESYNVSALDTAIVDDRLMALPEPNFVDGPNLFWIRKDWLDKLGLEEPETLEDVETIIRAFIEEDPGENGEGNTIGLVCHSDLTGESGYNYEFQLDPVFSTFGAYPKQWFRDETGQIVYGSVQPEAKEAISYLQQLYQDGVLDKNFMLRDMSNIAELIIDGKCGSFFGPWWAPNNPLMEAKTNDPDAVWEPYLIYTREDGKTLYFDQKPSYKYVVVRKDFEHPEIVFKMASVMFDKMRFAGEENKELEVYFQKNVDSTARPIAINIDYSDALYKCYVEINSVLNGEKEAEELQLLEHSYYEKCKGYLDAPEEADAEEWAAYASRIKACALIDEEKLEVISAAFFEETETMSEVWYQLEELEKTAYLEMISGIRDIDYFDEFVEEWKAAGGEAVLSEVNEMKY